MTQKFRTHRIAGGVLALMGLVCSGAWAQGASAPAPKPMTRTEKTDLRETQPLHTFFLKNCSQPNDGNELLTGLRLMLDPGIKIYLVPSQNAIVLKALPEELAVAGKLLAELDVPRKTYRLTYVVTESDASKKTGTQRQTVTVADGQRITLKQGSKVPVATGKMSEDGNKSETQMTYLDVGLNFDSTLGGFSNGATLKFKVEESSVGEPGASPTADIHDPTIHQVVIEGVSKLTLGKTTALGSLDVPGSAKHLEIEASLELAP